MASGLDNYGRSELHYAANESDMGKAESLIRNGSDVNLPDRNGWTPLHFAAQSGSVEIAKLLVDAGAHVDPLDGFGNSPLWRATFSSKGAGDVIQLLRSHGADPALENESGVSPVGLARTMANHDVAQYFSDLPE